jgi:hypothetical protein
MVKYFTHTIKTISGVSPAKVNVWIFFPAIVECLEPSSGIIGEQLPGAIRIVEPRFTPHGYRKDSCRLGAASGR